jgi:hypothetical protein
MEPYIMGTVPTTTKEDEDMGTKNNPGQFDCLAKVGPDEPFFLLRGKDPAAPYLVDMWAASRRGDREAVRYLALMMMNDAAVKGRVSSDTYEKLEEASRCAASMTKWREEKAHAPEAEVAAPAETEG